MFKVALGMLSTLIIFAIVAATFVPLGQILGRTLDEQKDRIAAYSVNVAASLAGVWCLNALAFMYQPPWAWFLVSLLSFAILARIRGETSISVHVTLSACLAV